MANAYEPVFFDIETTGFNPMAQGWMNQHKHDGRVTAIGLATSPNWADVSSWEDVEIDTMCLWDESEYRLLGVIRDRVQTIVDDIEDDGGEPFLVSYNGRQFDHPYLGARYSRLRQDGWPFTHGVKRLDMMRALGKHMPGTSRYPSEDDCLEQVGIESDDPYDGSDMPEAFDNGEWHKIKEHVVHDTEEMVKLFVAEKDHCLSEFYDHYDVQMETGADEVADF